MGVWDANIFDDDFALDVKGEYDEILKSVISHEVATQIIIDRYQDALDDPEEAGVFWLALATLQLECDSLIELVKVNALNVIISNSDLLRWGESPAATKRKQILEELKNQLLQKK
jgi:hypothetical protein